MQTHISSDGSYLSVPINNKTYRFHSVWLRDNARNPETISPGNGQRVITLLDQTQDIRLESAEISEDNHLQVRFQNDNLDYEYPLSWLSENSYDKPAVKASGWIDSSKNTWGRELQPNVPTARFTDVANNRQQLGMWLSAIRQYGFATMTALPSKQDALLDVVELFGFVRETNYGRFFEVRSEINPVNLAYTGLGLQAHTDNPYRDPVPTLQILSCIENTAEGGESIVVDGFHAVRTLQQENSKHFELLSRYCARFRYAGSDDVNLSSKRPMIELNADGELIAVRFNNRSSAPFVDIPFDVMSDYYQAYRHFAEIIERKENEVSFKLQADELFIVDNTRVMHSRNAFSGGGSRWLRGCYSDMDGLLSTLAVINSEQTFR